MNDNGMKRREWVKTAAIVFLSVMLVLTFFSNTIMNYSLPEVATQYVQSGTITARIRGTGTVESGDPYNVEVTESRKVAGVAVREGDSVQQGDVLFYLEDKESEELQAALEELETAQEAYDMALLTSEITSADIQAANNEVSAETFRYQITRAQNAVKAEEEKIKPLEERVASLTETIANYNKQMELESGYDTAAETRVNVTRIARDNADNARNDRQAALTAANNAKAAAEQRLADAQANSVSGGDAALISSLTEEVNKAEANRKAAEEAYNNAVNAAAEAARQHNEAVAAWNARQGSQVHANLTEARAWYEMELYGAQKELDAALLVKTEKEEELTLLVQKITNTMGLETYLNAIAKAQEKVDELTAKSMDATITAPVAGTVTSLNVAAGETTSASAPVAVLQPEGKGYTLSFSVTNDQARTLSVGDVADLVNAWRYDDVEVTLASIRPDTSDPGQRKMLTFDVTGNVVAGQTLNLSVGQRSANYDYIVPNSAIREDNNGKFILIVESKASPLGTRYRATRVDVEVLASDDTQSAITGGVYGYEFVITTSTKPVEVGQLVRLAE